ncbi:MAG: saccharopine dehydrogenase C-terminal domain-containing protein [Gemmatimonadota bacterium]
MKFLVLGGGAQGSAAAFDLVRRPEVESVVIADADPSHPRPFLQPYVDDRLRFTKLDATDHGAVREEMSAADAVVCGLPYFFNYAMAELAVESGCHYCDLGGNTELVEKQRTLHDEAKRRGVSVIPDCGLAPGMVNILAQAGIDALDRTESVKIRVGGVLDYYTTLSIVLEDGKLVKKDALTEIEPVIFQEPVGELEAFHTAGGISTMPYRYQGVIPHMEYKTLRYPGHASIMRAIRELGLLSLEPVPHGDDHIIPREVFIDVVSPRLRNPDGNDLVALRVEVEGTRDGDSKRVVFDLLDFYDRENRITAMMRTTGYSLAITSLMQADGRVESKGVHTPDEAVPAQAYIDELAAHGIEIRREG